jgi:hypothetical protein
MKKIKYFIFGTIVIGLIIFNFTNVNKEPSTDTNFTLRNISIMKSSAGEIICDATSTVTCQIGPNASGTGALIYIQ